MTAIQTDLQELSGSVEKVTYYNEESHFAVATLYAQKPPLITITGPMPGIQVGENVRCKGQWKHHTKHGLQFEVSSFEFELPKNIAAIEKFLGSGAVKGIGPGFAARIVATFGADTLEIIETAPERLVEVDGLGKTRSEALIASWNDHKRLQEVFIFLHGYGISRSYARRIVKTYGNQALQKIRENPYQLAKDVNGIGFTLADSIAKHLGFEQDFPARIQAGIDYILYELANEGHACYPLDAFSSKAQEILQVKQELVQLQIGRLFQQGNVELQKLANDQFFIWSKILFVCEQGIASEIERLRRHPTLIRKIDIDKAIIWAEEKHNICFALQQKKALFQALSEKFSLITGGPGTGKSTITKAIVSVLSKITTKILLAAPTGRAAKRLHEITGHIAFTLHRILKFDFAKGKFKHDRDCPLDVDLLIIDEASMIDTYLMYQILRALPNSTKVLIIGDANQLPSIGPGNVLRDLIDSDKLPVTILSAIFRQAAGSSIIVNAHLINEGNMPSSYAQNGNRNDFFFITAKEPEEVRQKILELIMNTIPQKFGFDAKKEIQLLVPMRKGPCGIEIFNQELQNILNPIKQGHHFRIGDKVMQLRNNYTKDVFNGDIGYITNIDISTHTLIVCIDDKEVSYDFSELEELTLAYAVSIHKYQGSECPCIVMPVHTVHFKLLTRNLLYTAVTRGRKLVVLVGTKKAVAIAVKNQQVDLRYTGLRMFL